MLSYLTHRHYHLLTKELPQELRSEQPKVVYLPTYNCEKVDYRNQKKNNSKLKLKRSKQIQQINIEMDDFCPICFSIDNITVEFYGKKHICVKCRKLMRDKYGNQTRIFLDEEGQIVCLGIKAPNKNGQECKKIYYYTDYTQLEINGRSAFATFAKPDEMVLILRLPDQSKQ